jgi:hypothetical protein
MEFHITELHGKVIAEVTSKDQCISETQDAVDLLGNCYYLGADRVILYQHQLTPAFFDLKTGIAGEILQKFSNYSMKLAIIGDYSAFTSQSLKDFIFESNKQGHICFVSSKEEALEKLSL